MTDNKYFVHGLLIATFLFVVSYFLVGWNGRYQFTSSSGAGVWKIDTVTGQVWSCVASAGMCGSIRNLR